MSSFLYRLGHLLVRRRRWVIVLWLLLLVIAGASTTLAAGTDDAFKVPGTQSQEARDYLGRIFPQISGTSAQFVIVVPPGADIAALAAKATAATASQLEAIDQVASVTNPFAPSEVDVPEGSPQPLSTPAISPDGRAAIVSIRLTVRSADVEDETLERIAELGPPLASAIGHGVTVTVGGAAFSDSVPKLSATEGIGLLVALLVLLMMFRSFVAAGMPLLTAILGVAIPVALIYMATSFASISSTAPMLAVMLGLAVGIDYALFLVSRHRDQLAEGQEVGESIARATATAGSAVIFAGLTVIVALLGLAVGGIPFLTTMGVAAAVAVIFAVAIAVTMIPALMAFAGERLRPKSARKSVPKAARKAARKSARKSARKRARKSASGTAEQIEEPITEPIPGLIMKPMLGPIRAPISEPSTERFPEPSTEPIAERIPEPGTEPIAEPAEKPAEKPKRSRFEWSRLWVRAATRVPTLTVVLIVGLLVVCSLPAAHLRLVLPGEESQARGTPTRDAYEMVTEHFGPGQSGPLVVIADIIASEDPIGVVNAIAADLSRLPGVARVPRASPDPKAHVGIIEVIPASAPDSAETAALVDTLRAQRDRLREVYDIDTAVTGVTAVGVDVSSRLGAALLPFAILVVGLSLVLLAMVFRSIWVPVKATAGYLLSVGAAFGLTSFVFVEGHFADVLGVERIGSVISFLPIILMGVLFGLAMDYEVFLVSRIRESYVHDGDAHGAIEKGFVSASGVVVAAAVIMFAVFAAFVPHGGVVLKPIAFGLAVGVFIDAFLVRMTLVPALLAMLGKRAWYLPGWIDRRLPIFDAEGDGLMNELRLADWPAPGSDNAIDAADLSRADDRGTPVYTGVNLAVPRGAILVIHGPAPSGKSALLYTLAGRVGRTSGDLKVLGHVLPQLLRTVRRKVAVIPCRQVADPHAVVAHALADGIELILLDDADLVVRMDERDQLRDELATRRTSSGRPVTYVLTCQDPARLGDLLPADPDVVMMLNVDPKPAGMTV